MSLRILSAPALHAPRLFIGGERAATRLELSQKLGCARMEGGSLCWAVLRTGHQVSVGQNPSLTGHR